MTEAVRLWLEREIAQQGTLDASPKPDPRRTFVFVMLNPSTADARTDDPTIRRCLGFARREGATRMVVVNLFSRRCTDPQGLLAPPSLPHKPTASERAAWVSAITRIDRVRRLGPKEHEMWLPRIVAAWGNGPRNAGMLVHARVNEFLEVARGRAIYCLGTTHEEMPRHPLYVRADAAVRLWRRA